MLRYAVESVHKWTLKFGLSAELARSFLPHMCPGVLDQQACMLLKPNLFSFGIQDFFGPTYTGSGYESGHLQTCEVHVHEPNCCGANSIVINS